MKKILVLIMVVLLTLGVLIGCNSASSEVDNDPVVIKDMDTTLNKKVDKIVNLEGDSIDSFIDDSVDDSLEDISLENIKLDTNYLNEESSVKTYIELTGDTALVEGNGIVISNDSITIKAVGTYEFIGNYTGQIIVDTEEEGYVQLILNGVNLSNEKSSPIYIVNAEDTIITLREDTTNIIYDVSDYQEDDSSEIERLNGAIYSKDDLIINGNGTLEITALNKSGILGKDDVIILSGSLVIEAAKNGIKGKDLIYIDGGDIQINAKTDGLDSDTMVVIKDGTIEIKSEIDGVHSDKAVYITGGVITITAGDDGVHGDVLVQIDGGELVILESFEGVEAKDIFMNNGNVYINAYDDGVNATDGSGRMGGKMGGPNSQSSYDFGLHISGGQLVINSYGDGLDSNGNVWMTGGVVIVSGPVENNNGGLDYNGEFYMTGGYLISTGSSGMLQSPGEDSTINSLVIGLDSMIEATNITIKDENGDILFNDTPIKAFQSIVFASPDLEIGKTYSIEIGGSNYASIELSDVITTYGTIGRGRGKR